MDNITKTIKESLDTYIDVFGQQINKNETITDVERLFSETQSHLLQSQIRLIDVVIEEMKSKKVDNETNEYYHGFAKLIDGGKAMDEFQRIYNLCLEDQISSLEEVKKSLLCECRHDGSTYSNIYCNECGNDNCKLCIKNN